MTPPVDYFPLRRAADSSQYRIGRAFLQEAYLQVDYERNTFSVFQALFDKYAVPEPNLFAITRPDHSTWPGSPSSSPASLSTGAKIGIVVGAVATAIAGTLLVWYICSKKGKSCVAAKEHEGMSDCPGLFARLRYPFGPGATVAELLGDKRQPTEVPADKSNARFELAGTTPIEMPAAGVSPTFLSGSNRAINDPRQPAELGSKNSVRKDAGAFASERSESPLPAYSPADIDQRNSISPCQHYGTASSGEQGISPIGVSPGTQPRRSSNARGNTSPVSPNYSTMPEAQRQISGDFLIPQTHTTLSRSPSRSSRFREEGLLEGTPYESLGPQRPPPLQARFSWEE